MREREGEEERDRERERESLRGCAGVTSLFRSHSEGLTVCITTEERRTTGEKPPGPGARAPEQPGAPGQGPRGPSQKRSRGIHPQRAVRRAGDVMSPGGPPVQPRCGGRR